jgi:hypothetical protein
MYIRLYPIKNDTIFKRSAGGLQEVNGTVNTGKSPISEITDGITQSAYLMQFDLSSIKPLLQVYPFTCNLKLWDAGVIFEPTITLKTMDLLYFEEDFSEGDGFTYLGNTALPEACNWIERVTGTPWSPAQPATFTQGLFPALQLNDANQDIMINGIQSFINTAISHSVNPNFGVRISTNTPSDQTYTKFLYTRTTRTIFKPFIEFFIQNDIIDGRTNALASTPVNLYLLSDSGQDFVGTLTAVINDETGTLVTAPVVNHLAPGQYYITYTPTMAQANSIMADIWSIDGVPIAKNLIPVKSPNVVNTGKLNTANLFFYPTTSYVHPTIRQNDVVTFNVISEVRGRGSIILPGYEYRIISTNGFEMQPWTPVSLYGNKLYFTVDTSYYYPEIEYEVFVRLIEGASTKTSAMTYKFRLTKDEATHMQSLAANPYSDRDAGFRSNSQG